MQCSISELSCTSYLHFNCYEGDTICKYLNELYTHFFCLSTYLITSETTYSSLVHFMPREETVVMHRSNASLLMPPQGYKCPFLSFSDGFFELYVVRLP